MATPRYKHLIKNTIFNFTLNAATESRKKLQNP
jgi:hypothetical protein